MSKTKKLEGYTAEVFTEEDKEDLESARLEAAELEADPEVVVPTGDEDAPVSGSVHDASLKTLYAKGRRNRELTMREDADGVPDVKMIQYMTEMASGGKTDAAEELDTNRDMDEAERLELARLLKAEEDGAAEETPEEEIVNEAADKASISLTETDPDARIQVKILGKEYEVPQQDIDDAGGVELYQKIRAANVRLQRAATLEAGAQKTLEETRQALEAKRETDPPSPDGLGEADIDSSRDELLELVINEGTEDDINEWILKQREAAVEAAKKSTPEPDPPPPTVIQETPRESEIQAEMRQQFEEDRLDTNTMMRSQYKDIMDDPELQSLAQQRFNWLATRDDSMGRSQKEMARESAEYVRSLGRRVLGDPAPAPSPSEEKRRTRVRRKRVLPQSSRAGAVAPDNRPEPKRVPTGKEHIQRLRERAGQVLPD